MRHKRLLPYAIAILIAGLACTVVFVTKPFAQGAPGGMPGGGAMAPGGMSGPPGGMPVGMPGGGGSPGGMPGGPGGGMMGPGGGGMGGGGSQQSGTAFSWTETDMPDELRMTYGEFLAQEGEAPVPLPEVYLIDDSGAPKRYSRNQWYSLARVYADNPVKSTALPTGRPGGQLWQTIFDEAAVKHNEINAVWKAWSQSLGGFWFEVGYPRLQGPNLLVDWSRRSLIRPDGTVAWKRWEAELANADSFQITVPVIMHIKPSAAQAVGKRFYQAMKPFDNPGDGRPGVRFVTYEHGQLQPHTMHLATESLSAWTQLWDQMEVQLQLFDTRRNEITRASRSAGISGNSVFTTLLNPPTLFYEPRYKFLLPREDDRFRGGRLNLDGKQGWYFEFQFTLTREQLKSLNNAKARIVVQNGPPERLRYLTTGSAGGGAAAGGAGGPGGMMGGAGGPGGPGGLMGGAGGPGGPGGGGPMPGGSGPGGAGPMPGGSGPGGAGPMMMGGAGGPGGPRR